MLKVGLLSATFFLDCTLELQKIVPVSSTFCSMGTTYLNLGGWTKVQQRFVSLMLIYRVIVIKTLLFLKWCWSIVSKLVFMNTSDLSLNHVDGFHWWAEDAHTIAQCSGSFWNGRKPKLIRRDLEDPESHEESFPDSKRNDELQQNWLYAWENLYMWETTSWLSEDLISDSAATHAVRLSSIETALRKIPDTLGCSTRIGGLSFLKNTAHGGTARHMAMFAWLQSPHDGGSLRSSFLPYLCFAQIQPAPNHGSFEAPATCKSLAGCARWIVLI